MYTHQLQSIYYFNGDDNWVCICFQGQEFGYIATSTPVVTSATGPENLGTVPRQKVHRNLVSWKFGIPIARMPQICPCDNVEGLACFLTVFYWIRVRNLRASLAKYTQNLHYSQVWQTTLHIRRKLVSSSDKWRFPTDT